MCSQYLFLFAQAHEEFRVSELFSAAELYGFEIKFSSFPGIEGADPSGPFMVLELADHDHALLLARRCVLVKSVFEFYGTATSYDELHEQVRARRSQWEKYVADTSFKFIVTAYNHTIPQESQKDIVESFSYMGMLGKIDMKNPEITLACFEEYGDPRAQPTQQNTDRVFRRVWFGRLIEEGSARLLIKKFDVKKRCYYGNTSMEAEMSLLMANQTLASPGKLIYDPFMGTGSTSYPTAHFGALVWGSDIDGRQMRGKTKPPGVYRAAAQYGIASRILDILTFDVTQNPWRLGNLFDAIVTDPPYGVRAGAKRLGKRDRPGKPAKPVDLTKVGISRPDDQPYVPPSKPYELSALAADLVLLARYMLKPKGRLVFFLPTITEEYDELDVHSFLCDGMELVANSLQNFGSWGRRLITIRKTTDLNYPPPTFAPPETQESDEHVPAHRDFREKYFRGITRADANAVEKTALGCETPV